ncbi:hypothetical protein PENSPDRAFT_753222 [Peniophora sp. CONT]|nr:hypothetical protein PENSPDRAFT_753222 [Peniophora sp. CONT]
MGACSVTGDTSEAVFEIPNLLGYYASPWTVDAVFGLIVLVAPQTDYALWSLLGPGALLELDGTNPYNRDHDSCESGDRILTYNAKETRRILASTITAQGNTIPYLLWRAANVNLRRAPHANELPSGYNVHPQRIKQFKAHLALLDRPPTGGLNYIDAETAEIIFRTLHGKHNEILDGLLKESDQKRREERMLEAHELMRQWLVIDKAIRDTNSDAMLYERDQASGRELRRSAMLANVTQVCAQVKLGR